MAKHLSKPSGDSLFPAGAHTTVRRVRERAMDGLETFRENRLRGGLKYLRQKGQVFST